MFSGCPERSIAKLPMSTTLLILRMPAAIKTSCIHLGDSLVLTPRITLPEKRGQLLVSEPTLKAAFSKG